MFEGVLYGDSNFLVYGQNPMMWPFKWKLSAYTFTWCYLFLKIFENEMWNFGWNLPLATFGSERVKGRLHDSLLQFTEMKIYSFYRQVQQRLKDICIIKQQPQEQPQKSHKQDILKNILLIFASYGTHVMNYFVLFGIFMRRGHRMQR